jgi:urease gamma subunit
MQPNKVALFHGDVQEVFVGGKAVKQFMKRLNQIVKGMETSQAISEMVTKAETGKGLNKLKASLKDRKLKP